MQHYIVKQVCLVISMWDRTHYLAAAVYTLKLKLRRTAANRVFCSKQYPPRGFRTSFSNVSSSLQLMTSLRSKACNSAAASVTTGQQWTSKNTRSVLMLRVPCAGSSRSEDVPLDDEVLNFQTGCL